MLLMMGLMVLIWARHGLPSLPGDSGLQTGSGAVPAGSPGTNRPNEPDQIKTGSGESGGVRSEVGPSPATAIGHPARLGEIGQFWRSGNQVGGAGEGQAEGLSLRMQAAGKLAAARESRSGW
jgi:hypothetical protein